MQLHRLQIDDQLIFRRVLNWARDSPGGSMSKQDFAVDEIARKIELGNRRALSRAITLVESSHPTHLDQAAELLQNLRTDRQAIRIGMSAK